MTLAYLITTAIVSAFFASVWVKKNLLNITVKLLWTTSSVWSVYELLVLLGKLPATWQSWLPILTWGMVGLAGYLGVVWSSKDITNITHKMTMLGLAVFSLVVAL